MLGQKHDLRRQEERDAKKPPKPPVLDIDQDDGFETDVPESVNTGPSSCGHVEALLPASQVDPEKSPKSSPRMQSHGNNDNCEITVTKGASDVLFTISYGALRDKALPTGDEPDSDAESDASCKTSITVNTVATRRTTAASKVVV